MGRLGAHAAEHECEVVCADKRPEGFEETLSESFQSIKRARQEEVEVRKVAKTSRGPGQGEKRPIRTLLDFGVTRGEVQGERCISDV